MTNPTMINACSLVIATLLTELKHAKHDILPDPDLPDDSLKLIENASDKKFYRIDYTFKNLKGRLLTIYTGMNKHHSLMKQNIDNTEHLTVWYQQPHKKLQNVLEFIHATDSKAKIVLLNKKGGFMNNIHIPYLGSAIKLITPCITSKITVTRQII